MDDGNVICGSCGREVDDSLTWCPACGATVARTPPVSDSERIGAELDGGSPQATWSAPRPEETTPQDPAASGDPFASVPPAWVPSDPTRSTGRTAAGPNRAATTAVALVVVALIGAGVAFFLHLRSDSGEPGTAAGDVEAAGLRPGDCWNDVSDGTGEVLEVPAVPCDQPHDNEVFAVVEVPGAPGSAFPGMETLDLLGEEKCLQEFAGYTGELYEFSSLDLWMLFPTPSSWELGDREVICSLYRMDLQKMIGSARATTP